MSSITTAQIEQNPGDFVRRVEAGEEMMIVRDSRPLAEIKPVSNHSAKRPRFGSCAGEFVVPDDFDDPLPEDILRDFEGA
jgi:antitoxin (DNA-binding transcriptional repressor) of toxin-antitoxin stability system